jgi:phage major head subunit gpT-like protein
VGYKVHKYETTPATEGAPMLARAVDWEPYEVSLVTIPADYGARIRSSNAETYQCEIVTRSEAVEAEPEQPEPVEVPTDQPAETAEEEKPMADQSKFVVEEDEIPTRKAPAAPSESEIITARETERCEGIFNGCRAAKIPSDYAMELISKKVDLSTARGMILDEMAKRGGDRVGGEAPGRVDVTGEDPLVHKRASIENAILHRAAPDLKGPDGKQLFPLSDEGKEYRGMSLLDIARTFLRARGVRVNHMSKMELAGAALGYRSDGMHTTSDFPLLLADVTNKVLRAAYEVAPQTYSAFTRNVSLPDFKSSKQLQVGEAPGLDEIREHGEYTSGTITESKEEFALKTWGKKFSITRTALINDDLSAFSRVPVQFGQSARNKESDIVWAIITANAALSDGVTLFYATTHVNLAGSATAISVDAIGLGRAAMRKQKGLDGVTVLNLNPRFLVVPAAKETIADQFVSTALMAYGSAQVNPFAGRLQVIAEPRLDANSATAWYLFASPDQIDMVLTATLEGQTGPVVESRVGFDIDGIEIKCRHDFNAKAVDYRGMYKNAGA